MLNSKLRSRSRLGGELAPPLPETRVVSNSGGRDLGSRSRVGAFLSLVFITLGVLAPSAQACFVPFGHDAGVRTSSSQWNVMDVQYNANLGTWEAAGVTHDPAADVYSPQAGDIVMLDENDEIALIFVSVPGDGGGGGGGGGELPPPNLQGSNDRELRFEDYEPSDQSVPGLACLSDPPPDDDVIPRIIVIGQRFNFDSLRFIVVRRGGWTGGGGGGGGGTPVRWRVPNNPYNSEVDASCSSEEAVRINYANQELAPHGLRPRVGQQVVITYRNGQRENFVVNCTLCSMRATPIAGTCR